jgi:hypothetical protein
LPTLAANWAKANNGTIDVIAHIHGLGKGVPFPG